MKKVLKRTLSVFLAVTMLFGTATLSGIADIDFSEFIEMIPKAEASSDCTIGCYVTKDLFDGFERNSDGFTVLYKGQEYYVPCQVQYTHCVFSDVTSDVVKYSIKNADTYEILYNSSTYLTESVHKGSFSIYIPDVFQEGCYYYIDVRLPSIDCSYHDCSSDNDYMYCVYVPYSYTLSYDANGGSGAPSAQTKCNKYTVPSTIPVRMGFNFLGWSTNRNATYADYTAGDTVNLSANTTLYAVWESVNVISIGNTYTANIYESYGNEYFKFIPPSNGIYVFESSGSLDSKVAILDSVGNEIASDDDSGDNNNFRLETYLNAGTVYFIKVSAYSVNTGSTLFSVKKLEYTVTYDANSGSFSGNNQTKKHGENLQLSTAVPTKKGYDFLGWAVKNEGSSSVLPGTPSDLPLINPEYQPEYQPGDIYDKNCSITLIAVWKPKEYAINYDANGGNGAPESQSGNFKYTIPSVVPKKEGYSFIGWSTDRWADKADYESGDAITVYTDTTLYAIWKRNYYKLNLYITNTEGETELLGIYYAYYDKSLYEYENVDIRESVNNNAPEGKVFDYWAYQNGEDASNDDMPAHDLNLYAQYKPKEITVYMYSDANGHGTEEMGVYWDEIYYGTDLYKDDENGTCEADRIKSYNFSDKVTPAEHLNVSKWEIYYVDDGADPYDKTNWKKGINADGTNIVKNTLIFHAAEWSQVCGENITWSFNEKTGELSIMGTGEITDNPWLRTYGLKIKSVVVSEGITVINGLNNLPYVTEISLPESTKKIGDLAFAECISLKEIKIPENVTSIGAGAFSGCTALEEITIPEKVTEIKMLTFVCCTNLEEIIIHKNIETIADAPFIGSGIKRFVVDKENKNFVSDEYGVLYNKDMTELIAYPVRNERTAYTIPDGVRTIKTYAFCGASINEDLSEETYGNDNLKAIIIPDSVTTIERNVFAGCQALEYVHIPSSVKTINNNILDESTAYICSDTENCYAKTYAEENGYTFKVCKGHKAHTHTYNEEIIKKASCTEDGVIKYTCDCLDSYTETVNKSGHKEGEWEIISEATKQSEGRKIKKCKTCGATVKEETIPKLSDSEPATKPVQPTRPSTTKPSVEPTTKPAQPTTKPTEPSTKPAQPTTKPTEPTAKPVTYTCPNCGQTFTNKDVYTEHRNLCDKNYKPNLAIRTPSTSTITYGDSIILHADVENLPDGASIKWTANNGNFSYTASDDGSTCTISPSANGTTTFTATVVDKNGDVICFDTQAITAKAGFFQKLIAFFKKLFGMTKVIPETFKSVF